MAIDPMAVSGDGKQDLRGVSRLKPAEGMLSPNIVSIGNRHPGWGLAVGWGMGRSLPSPNVLQEAT